MVPPATTMRRSQQQMAMPLSATSSAFRRLRVPANVSFLHSVQNLMFGMLTPPRSRMWRYPGMTLRNVTQADVDSAAGGKSVEIAGSWPRACLFFIQLGQRRVAALLFKESNRIEVLQPGPLPNDVFFGTIIDGFVEVSGSDVTFHVLDVIRMKGCWIPARVPFEQRLAEAAFLSRLPGPLLGIAVPVAQDGIPTLTAPDRLAVIVTRNPQRAFVTSVVMVVDAQAESETHTNMAEDDERYAEY